MTESTIQCHQCGAIIPLTQALIAQVRASVETDLKRDHEERLSGDEFRHRVEAIVETFHAMQEPLSKERRAMEKLWNERAKQLERLTVNTVAMYGAIRGMIGSQLPEIPALELDALPPSACAEHADRPGEPR